MRRLNKYAAFLLVAGTSFLFLPQAQANTGLQAYFYDNYTQDNLYNDAPPIPPDTPMVINIAVATVDQDFDASPVAELYEDFVVKYEGYITATESGTANLQCLADDGCIVIIDGVTIINEWWDKGTSGDVYQYPLVPNQSLPITVWYYENGGGAVVQLRWQLGESDWVVVPESVFSTIPQVTLIVDSPSETHTVVSETVTVPDSSTSTVLPVETQTSTSESSTQTSQTETQTPISETPLPTPTPVVEPQPIVVPIPQPIPQPQPEPEPVVEVIDEEAPSEELPLEEQPVVEEQQPVEEPSELPTEEETNETPVEEPEIVEPSEPNPEPSPQPTVEPEPVPQPEIAYEPPTVTLDNGVILTQEEAVAVELLQNPAELLSELFSDPGAVFSALGSVGADMSPEVREQSEKIVLSAVIAGNIATQAAATAGAVAAYRRKQ